MTYKSKYENWLKKCSEAEVRQLKSLSEDEIKESFSGSLAFGTAGMRGIVGLGTARINNYTVMRATQGVSDYIATLGEDAKREGVLIAYDTRRFSFEFALVAARVLAENKIKAYLFENVRPVPMCSFAVRYLGCVVGIMITASHNPKEYNGYKVYGEDGAQMSPEPTDKVVGFIDKISDYFSVKLSKVATLDWSKIKGKDNYELNEYIRIVGKSIDEEYYKCLDKLSLAKEAVAKLGSSIKIVYTPIHGSGYIPVTTVLARMGINVNVVEEQKYPDTEFSTVGAPNPEQPDALSMGISLANKLSSDIVIGTDPDCDRMGVAIRNDKGEFVLLNGNQIGAMLMDYILLRHKEKGTLPKNAAVVKTIVTTHFADNIAKSYAVKVFNVLTGFKFIGEKIKEWEATGEHTFMFGYEESFGYLSGTHARDKDAVISTMLFAEMTCYYQSKGQSVWGRLEELYKKFGYFREENVSKDFKGLDGMEKMSAIMDKLRAIKLEEIAGEKVLMAADYKSGQQVSGSGKMEKIDLPKTNVLLYSLPNSQWVAVRPSGTEPKLKIYVSAVGGNAKEAKDKCKAMQSFMKELL